MTMDITYFEDKERLEQDRIELQKCLADIELLTHINKNTDIDTYIEKYVLNHYDLTIEELEDRIKEIHNIFYAVRNE